jgi:hypothetical protein
MKRCLSIDLIARMHGSVQAEEQILERLDHFLAGIESRKSGSYGSAKDEAKTATGGYGKRHWLLELSSCRSAT